MTRRDTVTEELEFEGKRYVSSIRAAELVHYTKDYVGQLARAGKLDARLVGRSWYVAVDAIKEHKRTANYTLTKSKKRRKTLPSAHREGDDISIQIIDSIGDADHPTEVESVPDVHLEGRALEKLEPAAPERSNNAPATETIPSEESHEDVDLPVLDSDRAQDEAEEPAALAFVDRHVKSVPIQDRTERRARVDPLVHTSIRYEPGERFDFDEEGGNSSKQTLRYEGVPIARPAPVAAQGRTFSAGTIRTRGIAHQVASGAPQGRQLMDGILVRAGGERGQRSVRANNELDAAHAYRSQERSVHRPKAAAHVLLFVGAFVCCLGIVLLLLHFFA